MAAHAAAAGQHISLHIDAACVVRWLQCVHRQEALRCGANGNLWDTLLEFIEVKKLTVAIEKVKCCWPTLEQTLQPNDRSTTTALVRRATWRRSPS